MSKSCCLDDNSTQSTLDRLKCVTISLHLAMAEDKVLSFSPTCTNEFKVQPAQGMCILFRSSLSDMTMFDPLSIVKQDTS